MADRFQPWQWGDPNPVDTNAVPSATVIEIGDMVGLVAANGNPFPASDTAWGVDLAATQAAFAGLFLGVSQDRSRAGDILSIRCGTSGVYLFDCASSTWKLGDLVGPAKQAGLFLESKKVATAVLAGAIGRVARKEEAAVTKVYVEIFSKVMRGGPQA